MALDFEILKGQCNVTGTDDDAVLGRILRAAEAHTSAQLGFATNDAAKFPTGTPDDLEHAVLMLAAHWFENREATLVGVTAQSIPFGYDDIIRNHRSWYFG